MKISDVEATILREHNSTTNNHRLFHVTDSENRASIENHGLLVSSDSTGFGAIYLTDTIPDEGNMDVWSVDVTGLELDEDWTGEPEDEAWYMFFDNIEPSRLTLMRKSN